MTQEAPRVTSRSNCPLCQAKQPGRHPDRGGTHLYQPAGMTLAEYRQMLMDDADEYARQVERGEA